MRRLNRRRSVILTIWVALVLFSIPPVLLGPPSLTTEDATFLPPPLPPAAVPQSTLQHYCFTHNVTKQHTTKRRPTFLWGIPTYDAPMETERRQTIRNTYLSFYQDHSTPGESHRICSLAEFTCHPDWECQIVYTFFMGANPHAKPELLNPKLNHYGKMMVSTVLSNTPLEQDIVYLNIRENQFDGKMPTWFQFGVLVAQEYPTIDYIAKVDSDTLVLIPNLLRYLQSTLPPTTPDHVYGGVAFPPTSCDLNATDHDHACPLPLVGDSYMSGEFNFMSIDLFLIVFNNLNI